MEDGLQDILRNFFGYWEVWHIVLAIWLWLMIFFQRFPMNYLTGWAKPILSKHKTTLLVLLIAVIFECVQPLWGYGYTKAHFANSFKDLLAALVGIVICLYSVSTFIKKST